MGTGRQFHQSAPAAEEQFSPPAQDGLSLILAAAMRYVLAGLAVLLVVVVVAWILGYSARAFAYALAAGVLWSSLLLVLDFSRDPLTTEWQLWQARQAIAHAERLERDIASLRHENEENLKRLAQARYAATAWQHEAQKGNRAYVAPSAPPDNPEVKDALKLVRRRYERQEPVSKEYMLKVGWSADRYLAASAVLRERGYFSRNNQWKAFASAAEALAAFNGRTE